MVPWLGGHYLHLHHHDSFLVVALGNAMHTYVTEINGVMQDICWHMFLDMHRECLCANELHQQSCRLIAVCHWMDLCYVCHWMDLRHFCSAIVSLNRGDRLWMLWLFRECIMNSFFHLFMILGSKFQNVV